jgi:hypothetical protein
MATFMAVTAVVLGLAFATRHRIEDGYTSPAFSPWSAQVAYLTWAHGPPTDAKLPTCALYLGEAGGTTVVYDATMRQTWRIPSSELIVRAQPSLSTCPSRRSA